MLRNTEKHVDGGEVFVACKVINFNISQNDEFTWPEKNLTNVTAKILWVSKFIRYKHTRCIPRWNNVKTVSTSLRKSKNWTSFDFYTNLCLDITQ